MSTKNTSKINNEMLWHKRLAHLNPKYIDRLVKKSLVENTNKICKGLIEIEYKSCTTSKLTVYLQLILYITVLLIYI